MAIVIKRFFLLHLFLMFITNTALCTSIIIDIEGFLIKEIRSKVIWDIGPTKLMGFYNPTKVSENYFANLDRIAPQTGAYPLTAKYGLTLPHIVKKWLANDEPTEQIKLFVIQELKKIEQRSGNSTKLDQAIASHMFTPSRYAKVRECEKEGLKILETLFCQVDNQGNHKFKLFDLSNQNDKAYEEMCTNKDIKKGINFFNDNVISGHVHMVKPDSELFKYAFKRFGITDDEIKIYIDEEITFINAISSLGIKNLFCIHLKDGNFKAVVEALKGLGIHC